MPADLTLEALHGVIQRAMGWENEHDYRFSLSVGQSSVERALEVRSLLKTVISQTYTFYYTYDFQSGWLHRLELETADAATDAAAVPLCLGGAAACPPEGAGGVWGYDELLARLENPDDPDYLDLIDKYSSFDPDKFDLKAANERLKA